MAFRQQATLLGFDRVFEVSSACRPYTLRDNGFTNTPSGNFIYERPLDTDHRQGLVLKVTISKDLTGLSISTVSANGLRKINVLKLANNEMIIEKINFIFDGFVDRNCLIEID